MILVHCSLDRIKLYNLYGKNWIDYYRFDFHHGARAPGKVTVASHLITMDRDIDVRGDPKESNSIRPFVNLSVEEVDCMHDSLINIGVL